MLAASRRVKGRAKPRFSAPFLKLRPRRSHVARITPPSFFNLTRARRRRTRYIERVNAAALGEHAGDVAPDTGAAF
jgi:hypothetical protein